MSLTQAQIIRLQKLTAIAREGDLDISGVLDSFESLKDGQIQLPDTLSRSGESILHLRSDTPLPPVCTPRSLLDCSHQRVVADQIALSSIMVGE